MGRPNRWPLGRLYCWLSRSPHHGPDPNGSGSTGPPGAAGLLLNAGNAQRPLPRSLRSPL
eukprot:14556474-Heterocapsa_arctica.AAC.1